MLEESSAEKRSHPHARSIIFGVLVLRESSMPGGTRMLLPIGFTQCLLHNRRPLFLGLGLSTSSRQCRAVSFFGVPLLHPAQPWASSQKQSRVGISFISSLPSASIKPFTSVRQPMTSKSHSVGCRKPISGTRYIFMYCSLTNSMRQWNYHGSPV